ncbi:SgcJ/EcaC family oxidoreductase [uncultured Rubinisphaera sp.]|uniref:YybH family protein n=1 Tax=uncultured Rubinisphaera sp. TaxID=1678686 RepID=UPI0030D823CE
MRIVLLFAAVCLVGSVSSVNSSAQDPKTSKVTKLQASEIAAIRQESKAFVTAFNNHDSKAVAALWTEDGEYIDEAGVTLSGQTEIEKAYAKFFEANPKSKMNIVIDSVRILSEGSAI